MGFARSASGVRCALASLSSSRTRKAAERCLRFGLPDLGFYRRQRPWPEILHQDHVTAILLSAVALHPAEICERAKLESVAQRHEEIVLVTRQNVTRLQTFQRRGQSFARIGQGHAQDREIYFLVRRQLRKCSPESVLIPLPVHFVQKPHRSPQNQSTARCGHPACRPSKGPLPESPSFLAG